MKLRKLLSALVSGAMVLGTLAAVPVFADDSTNWDDSSITITTEAQLRTLAEKVNAGNSFINQTIILGDNITLNDVWTPIGSKSGEKYFSGTFDGANKEISGLSIIDDSDGNTDYFALFGATQNAVIKDLTVSGSVHEKNVAGIVARMNGGVVQDCVSNVAVTATGKGAGIVCLAGATEDVSVIENCVNNGTVTIAGDTNAGTAGIISYISSTGLVKVTNCVNKANITGGNYVGGILSYGAGNSQFIIDGCKNEGTVNGNTAAGIAGFVGGGTGKKIIKNCETDGNVAGTIQSGIFINNTYTGNVFGNATVSNYVIDPVALVNGDTYYATLADAVAAAQNGDTVTVLSDCTIDAPIEIKKSISIVGDGETAPTIKTTTANRVFNINENSEDLSISIKNIKAIEDSKNTYTRGISLYNNTGKIELNIDECEISSTYYALNVASNNSNVDIKVNNSKLNGWAVAQTWSSNTSITINDSQCISLNDKGKSEWNGFAAFVFNEDVTNTNITLNDTEVECKAPTGNNQTLVSFRSSKPNNNLTINGGKYTGYTSFDVIDYESGCDINITGGTFSSDVKDYVVNGYYSKANDNGTYTVVEAEATVIDTAKTTGATVTLDNLHTSNAVNPTDDATYQVVVETAPAANANAVNNAIEESKQTDKPDNNTSKAMFDISVIKTDSNGTKSEVNVTNQPVTLTLGETPSDPVDVRVYHVDGSTVTEIQRNETDKLTVSGNKVSFIAPSFSTYAVTYNTGAVDAGTIATKVGVVFSKVQNSSNQYYITLKSLESGMKINRFMSTDLVFNNGCATVDYDITPAANMTASVVSENGTSREYRFNMDGTNQSCASSEIGGGITIGTITFHGYGTLDFSVKTTDYTSGHAINIVNTAEATNNIVASYTLDGNTLVVNSLTPGDVNNNIASDESGTITGVTLKPETKDLTVNIAYNNAIADNAATYQDMTVTISGGDLTTPIVKHLGKTEYTLADNTYTVEVANELTQNVSYTVTVEGAGYRTARYTVNMATNKTLNFWNNVMDNEKNIETGVGTPSKTNFLAGDIVKDNQINIYDLSAVVSYFGSAATVDNNYAKYDLNRDGKIDSKDVAYVLVSWGK